MGELVPVNINLQPYISQVDELMTELKRGFQSERESTLMAERRRAWLDKFGASRREIVLGAEIVILNGKAGQLDRKQG